MTLQERLADIVGAAHVLTAPEDTKPYLTDWRRQYTGPAECVVRPASTQEVARAVALCAREEVAVVPQGGITGLVGGSVPTGRRREVVLALGRMNRIRELDALNDTVTAEAGCVLAAVQRAADEAGRLFPLSLAAEGGWRVGNADVTIVTETPKLAPHAAAMRDELARALGVTSGDVSVKATRHEGLGAIGRSEGLLALAVVLMVKKEKA